VVEKHIFRERKEFEGLVRELDKNVGSAIVEGLKDKIVLQKLGFSGKIFLSAERSNEDLCEDVARGSERVAILTDFDSHGREQNRKIESLLEGKVDVINSLRRDIGAQMAENDRYAIEDIMPVLKDKNQKFVEEKLDEISLKADN